MRWLHDCLPPADARFLALTSRSFTQIPASAELTYGEAPLPLLGWPLVMSAAEVQLLRRLASALAAGLESFTRRAVSQHSLDGMGFSPLQKEFVRMDPGYHRSVPIARIDAYWTDRGPQFLEVNTDGTAYVDYADRLNEGFLDVMGPFLGPRAQRLEHFSMKGALLRTLIASYREFSATRGRSPNARPCVAILDYREVKTRQDQEGIARHFTEHGVPAYRVDPRELRFRSGRLLCGHGPIDIVYRRATSREIFTRPHDFTALLAAYRAGAVCVVGSFRSDLGFHKASLEWALRSLPPTSRRRTERFIPKILIGRSAEQAIDRRMGYLYKPADRNQGKGIQLGSQSTGSAWRRYVRKARKGEGALQRLVVPPTVRPPRELGLERYGGLRLNLGIFVIGGRLAGLCARLTPDLILRERSPEWLVPVYGQNR